MGRLRWLCRRGMKELDVLLEAFLARHRSELDAGGFPHFEALLAAEDDRLWDWLQGGQGSAPAEFSDLISELRRGA